MASYEIKVSKTLRFSREDLLDILCSCFEGGCNYWCVIDNGSPAWCEVEDDIIGGTNSDYTIEDVMLALMERDGNIHLIDAEDDDVDWYLSLNKSLDGIKLSVEKGFWNGNHIGDIDGEIGDCIIQYALFEEIIYG